MTHRRPGPLTIGVIRLTFAVPADTLKEKRAILRSLIDRLRARFNASVVEADAQDDPAHAVIAVACLSNDARYVDGQLQAVLRAVEASHSDAVLVDVETESIAV